MSASKDFNTFVKGIITEASPLTFPEFASVDEDNFVLNRDGSRQRRLGIDFEENYTLIDTFNKPADITQFNVDSYVWKSVGNVSSIAFVLVQFGPKIYIFDQSTTTISNNYITSVDFTDKKTDYSPTIGSKPLQFDSGMGVCFVASPEIEPFYLKYDLTSETFSTHEIDIKIRDFFGVDDGLAVDTRPPSLTSAHKYNLFNQGWSISEINAVGYPSNSDIIYLGKVENAADPDDIGTFSATQLNKNYFGNTPAPKGRYTIDAFNRSTSRNLASGITVGTDIEKGRPSTTAFYSGRIFYSGIPSEVLKTGANKTVDYSGYIFFSPTLEHLDIAGDCFQAADPTSEDISELVATDGGVINIPEIEHVVRITEANKSLVVLATNGVWEVLGGESGFAANDYQVRKITSSGCISPGSVVEVEGAIYYWGEGGIYQLSIDQVAATLSANNITENTIQTYYNNIGNSAKLYVQSVYNSSQRKIRWMYNADTTFDGLADVNKYNKELVLDTLLGAFYPSTIDDTNVYIAGYVQTSSFQTAARVHDVVSNEIDVISNTEDVIMTQNILTGSPVVTKYLAISVNTTSGNIQGTFAEYKDDNFVDWKSFDDVGSDYSSYLITGYETAGDVMRVKDVPYLMVNFLQTEDGYVQALDGSTIFNRPSSCIMKASWDWSTSDQSGRWSSPFQAYRLGRTSFPELTNDAFDYYSKVVTTKNKLRGRGRALSLYFESEAGYDMHILGWSILVSGRAAP